MLNDEEAPRYLTQFKNLQALSLAGDMCNFPHYGNPEPESMVTACIQHVPLTVFRLSVLADSVWNTPLPVLSGLHELSLQRPQSLDKLSIVFQHCSQLRTLNVLIDNVACKQQFIAVLEAAPAALPHLTSFKFISCSREAPNINPDLFTAFLKNKKAMRRLDLRFYNRLEDVTDYARLLDMVASLPKLEVAGLVLRGEKFTREHLQLLDERLPPGLTALLLNWEFSSADDGVRKEDWIAMVSGINSIHGLQFISERISSVSVAQATPVAGLPPRSRFYGECPRLCIQSRLVQTAAEGPSAGSRIGRVRLVPKHFSARPRDW